jgi:hypothetical protein
MPATYAFVLEKAYALAKGQELRHAVRRHHGHGRLHIQQFQAGRRASPSIATSRTGARSHQSDDRLQVHLQDSTRLPCPRSGPDRRDLSCPSRSEQELGSDSRNVTVQYAPGMNQISSRSHSLRRSRRRPRTAGLRLRARSGGARQSLLDGHRESVVGQAGPAQWAGKLSVARSALLQQHRRLSVQHRRSEGRAEEIEIPQRVHRDDQICRRLPRDRANRGKSLCESAKIGGEAERR